MSAHLHASGDVIGEMYEIVEYVGEGGMQQVYLARDTLLERDVAIKSPKNLSASKRFNRSAVVAARVNHANVAKTLDYLEQGNLAYLVEEFVSGNDLSRVIAIFEGFDPLTAARIFHRLAKGLAASHHAGVVHRDLKPSNIMVEDGDLLTEVKITDFGIAKMAEEEIAEAVESDASLTASQTAIGALPYMAPEMIQSVKNAGKPADVWSIGAMMFEVLLGQKPFGSGLKAVPKILDGSVSYSNKTSIFKVQFRHLADEILSIIRNCIVKDPAARLTADQLVSRCEQLCYPVTPLEKGTISVFDNGYWGFANSDSGADVFFHRENCPVAYKPKVGDRIVFARHSGGGNDRAFPVIALAKARPKSR